MLLVDSFSQLLYLELFYFELQTSIFCWGNLNILVIISLVAISITDRSLGILCLVALGVINDNKL